VSEIVGETVVEGENEVDGVMLSETEVLPELLKLKEVEGVCEGGADCEVEGLRDTELVKLAALLFDSEGEVVTDGVSEAGSEFETEFESERDGLSLFEAERLVLALIEGVELAVKLVEGLREAESEIDGVMVGVAEIEGVVDMVGVIEGLAVGVFDSLRVGLIEGEIEVEGP
jgi:hypothetical protein